jgi:hypothetical protein
MERRRNADRTPMDRRQNDLFSSSISHSNTKFLLVIKQLTANGMLPDLYSCRSLGRYLTPICLREGVMPASTNEIE